MLSAIHGYVIAHLNTYSHSAIKRCLLITSEFVSTKMPCKFRQFFIYRSVLKHDFISLQSTRCLSNAIVNSPYPNIEIPDTTVNKLIWKDLNKWGNRTAIVSSPIIIPLTSQYCELNE